MEEYICQFCGKKCKNKGGWVSHEHCCKSNPNRKSYYHSMNSGHHKGCIVWNKGKTKENDERILKQVLTLKKHILEGKVIPSYLGRKRTKEEKEKISLARSEIIENNGAFKNVKLYKLKNILNEEFNCQGTWEYNVAKKLNELGILWVRKKKIEYIVDNIIKIYNPDFYLPKTNEYIEVKGYFWEKDKIKMNIVTEQYPDEKIIFIDDKYYMDFINNKIDIIDIPYYKDREFIKNII